MKELVCAGCGAKLNGRSCQLKCYLCGYSETCSDLLPALESEKSAARQEKPKRKPNGWDEDLMYRIYKGLE